MTDDQHPAPTTPDRRRCWAAAAAAALALMGAVTLGYAVGHQQSPPPSTAGAATQLVDRELPPPAAASPGTAVPAAPEARGPVLDAAPPTSIAIPTIGVTSVVNDVGLNPDGTMEVPQPGPLYDQAAWYRSSPSPGQVGPAVIIGHVDSAEDGPSVFFELGKLARGQRIDVERADGTTASFEVDEVKTYAKDAFPLETVYGNTDRAELRLITCGGAFDETERSYQDNVVVFAHLVASAR